MRKYILSLVCSSIAIWASASVSRTYYANVDGKSGSSLFSTLTTITNTGYHSLGYDGLYTAYRQTDVYPADSIGRAGDVWDIYGDCEFSAGEKCGSYSHECDCYNREHSIPQSWWGGGTGTIGCDIFHVIPTDGKVNGIRSNYPYGEVSGSGSYNYNGNKKGTSVTSGVGTVFEPRDEYKGDLARGILGTIMKWNTSKTMTSSEGSKFFQNSYTASSNYGLTTYAVNLLLKWHRQDPVSRKEIDRNNGIQATQGNRNPFIDFPYLVEYIWGNCKGQTVVLDSLVASFESAFVPGVSNGWGGGSITPDNPGTGIDTDNPGTDTDNPGTDTGDTDFDNPDTDTDDDEILPTGVHRGCIDFSSLYSGTAVDPAKAFMLCGDSVVLTLIDGSNPCKYYNDAIRVYAGGALSFESVEPLKSITLSYGTGDYTNQITADCGTWNDPTWTGNSNSVVLTVGGSSKHRRVASVCVVFGEEVDDEPVVTAITHTTQMQANVILKNGRIVIVRNGECYDLFGRRE